MARPTKLNKPLQNKLVKLIKLGVGIADACANVGISEPTFYGWMAKGEQDDAEFLEFFKSVNRARNAAKVAAIDTLRTSMSPVRTVKRVKNTITETRFNPYGKQFDYTRTDEHEIVMDMPGDWRAAVEYLKRRFPDEWSEKRILELGLSPDLLSRLAEVAKAADVPASQLFENMLNAISDQLQLSGSANAGDRDRAASDGG